MNQLYPYLHTHMSRSIYPGPLLDRFLFGHCRAVRSFLRYTEVLACFCRGFLNTALGEFCFSACCTALASLGLQISTALVRGFHSNAEPNLQEGQKGVKGSPTEPRLTLPSRSLSPRCLRHPRPRTILLYLFNNHSGVSQPFQKICGFHRPTPSKVISSSSWM